MSKILPNNAVDIIRQSGAGSLPDNPSQSGFNAKQIKAAIERPNTVITQWLSSLDQKVEFDPSLLKVVSSLPVSFSSYEEGTVFLVIGDDDLTFYLYDGETASKVGYSLSEYVSHISALEGYFTDGKAKNAIADKDGNDIVSTYETKSHSASEIDKLKDGTYTAKKAEQDASGNTITSTYATKAEEIVNNATAKQEAIESAAATAQAKVDALASALDFDNGTFGEINADKIVARDFFAERTKTINSAIEEAFFEYLKGNESDLSSNYAGSEFTKYNGANDFFLGLHGHELVFGKANVNRDSEGNVIGISDMSLIPAMGRAATIALENDHLLKWDSATKKAVDAGMSLATFAGQEATRVANESARVLAEQGRVSAEQARVLAETNRALQEKYRVINHPYAITQAEYNTLMNGGVFGVHLSTPLIEGDEPQPIYTVYASQALAEAANETYIFPIQDNIQYPPKGIGGDAPYLDIPAPPVSDGTYVLKCTVANGVVTYSWEAEE